eukprot:7380969-Prymnesium_polylepis.1
MLCTPAHADPIPRLKWMVHSCIMSDPCDIWTAAAGPLWSVCAPIMSTPRTMTVAPFEVSTRSMGETRPLKSSHLPCKTTCWPCATRLRFWVIVGSCPVVYLSSLELCSLLTQYGEPCAARKIVAARGELISVLRASTLSTRMLSGARGGNGGTLGTGGGGGGGGGEGGSDGDGGGAPGKGGEGGNRGGVIGTGETGGDGGTDGGESGGHLGDGGVAGAGSGGGSIGGTGGGRRHDCPEVSQ